MLRSAFVVALLLGFIAVLGVLYKTKLASTGSSVESHHHVERQLQGNVTSFYSVEWHATQDGACANETLPNITLSCNGGDIIAIEYESEGVSCGLADGLSLTLICSVVQAVAGLTYTVDFTCIGSSLNETTAEATIEEHTNDCLGGDELAVWGHGLRLGLVCDDVLVLNGTCTPQNTTFPDSSCGTGWFCPGDCPVGSYTTAAMTSSINENNCADYASSTGTAPPSGSPTMVNESVPEATPAPFIPQTSNVASFYTAYWSYSYEGICAEGLPTPTVILKCGGGESIGIETRSQGVACESLDDLSVECSAAQGIDNSEHSVDFNCLGWSLNDTAAEAIIPEQVNSCLGGGITEWNHKILVNVLCDGGNRFVNGTCNPMDTTLPDQSCGSSWSCSGLDCPASIFTSGAISSAVSGNNCKDTSPPTIPSMSSPTTSPIVSPTELPTISEDLPPTMSPMVLVEGTDEPTSVATDAPTVNPEGSLFETSGSSNTGRRHTCTVVAMILAGLVTKLL